MLIDIVGFLGAGGMTTPPTHPSPHLLYGCGTSCDSNTMSVVQQMQNNTDHLVTHQVEMQEMRKLIQFQQDQYKLTSRLFSK